MARSIEKVEEYLLNSCLKQPTGDQANWEQAINFIIITMEIKKKAVHFSCNSLMTLTTGPKSTYSNLSTGAACL